MMFCSVIVFCLLVIGLHGNAVTELSANAKYTNVIDNSTGFYVAIADLAQPIVTQPVTVTPETTTAIVIITRSINEPAENNTRFTCGKYNPCHWQVYNEERTFEMGYPSVCDCPNNTICRYYRDNLSIRAFEFRCMEVNLTLTEPETSSASEASSTDSV